MTAIIATTRTTCNTEFEPDPAAIIASVRHLCPTCRDGEDGSRSPPVCPICRRTVKSGRPRCEFGR
jgi:hypothetical protein